MFLTNQPFQIGWEMQKNKLLVKVSQIFIQTQKQGLELLQNSSSEKPVEQSLAYSKQEDIFVLPLTRIEIQR